MRTLALALGAALSLALCSPSTATAQVSRSRTTPRGATVTHSRSISNGVLHNDRSATTASGRTYTRSKTQERTDHGRVITHQSRTGPEGRSLDRTTLHGPRGSGSRVTGPAGNSRAVVRRRN